MKLLLVTDHKFYSSGGIVYDDYVFGYEFFKPYLEVFEEVVVVARIAYLDDPKGLQRSSGHRLTFFPLSDIHGVKWFFALSRRLRNELRAVPTENSDVVCFRVPSSASWHVWRRHFGIRQDRHTPIVFECIGDPESSLATSKRAPILRKLMLLIISKLNAWRMRYLIRQCIAGSYVSKLHLQGKYPPLYREKSWSISSIRLPASDIVNRHSFSERGDCIRLVHVGSFVEVKNQEFIIETIRHLISMGYTVEATLVGSGDGLNRCKRIVVEEGLENVVSFTGQVVGRDSLNVILDDHDFFILPSLSEGLPRSLLEAMARGLVCIGSNIPAIGELLSSDFRFELSDPKGAANLIADIWTGGMVQDISRNNIQTAEMFSQDVLHLKRIEFMKFARESVE